MHFSRLSTRANLIAAVAAVLLVLILSRGKNKLEETESSSGHETTTRSSKGGVNRVRHHQQQSFSESLRFEAPASTSHRILEENTMEGTDEWWRPYFAEGPITSNDENEVKLRALNREIDRQSMQLEGFTSKFSVEREGTIDFKIDYVVSASANETNLNTKSDSDRGKENFRLRIYRLGYYGGKGARLVDDIPFSVWPDANDKKWKAHNMHLFQDTRNHHFLHSQPECLFQEST